MGTMRRKARIISGILYLGIDKCCIQHYNDSRFHFKLREMGYRNVSKEEKKPSQSLKQIVYEDLKRRIISCEILPGTQLTEEILCEQLKASRTPVRDALSRLEQEQLLTIHPKKGIFVNTVSLANVSELFEARLRIEPYAVQYYGNRIGDDVYVECIRRFESETRKSRELYRLDDEFHQMFIDATRNRYLIMFYNTVRDQTMRYRVLSAMERRLFDSQAEHREVAMQCLRGNWERAAEAMRSHIENSKISILDYVMHQNRDAKNIFAATDIPAEAPET